MSIHSQVLRRQIEEIAPDLLAILKALANEKRLELLAGLLEGPLAFQSLLQITGLQKTALANHLQVLQQSLLISKPDYGYYELTPDGVDFLASLHQTWRQSAAAQQQKLGRLQSRGMSSAFLTGYLFKH